jgi:fructose-bisphosphate aldolase/2-amino-3,7-dideoxy-D-threo-hept-6-ulosonate synthase
VGRNSFQREDTRAFVQALCQVVHDEVDPEKALGKKR